MAGKSKKKKTPKKKRDEKNDTKVRIRKTHSREISIRAVRLDMEKMSLVSILATMPYNRLKKLVQSLKKAAQKKSDKNKKETKKVVRNKVKNKAPLKVHKIIIGK